MPDIRPISDPIAWNQWLLQRNPNTFLQSAEWAELQGQHGAQHHPVGFFENDEQIGAALLLTINAKRGRFVFCPHGPIFESEVLTRKHLPAFFAYASDYVREQSAVALRISPLLLTTPENSGVFTAQHFRPAPTHVHTELTWMLDLDKPEDTLLRNMRKTTRQAIHKAASVTTEVITDPLAIDRFLPLYQATKQRHQFIPFTDQFLRDQFAIFGRANRSYAVIARHEDRDVAAGLFIHFGNTVFYHHGASIPSSVPAAHAVQWRSIQEAKRRGAMRYNFWGIAPDNEPHHPFAGITIFKKGFGGYPLDYMHAQDWPLNLKYWKLWAVDTWRHYRRGF